MLGKKGEAIAAKFLQHKGYEIILQNFHAQGGEIDLVTKDPKGQFVFVEVKTRTNDAFGGVEYSITKAKFEKMMKAIDSFFAKHLQEKEMPHFCIDAILLKVQGQKVFCEHIENIGSEDFDETF